MGEFAAEGLRPGDYDLRFFAPETVFPEPRVVSITSGMNEYMWTLPRDRVVRGIVIDQATGTALADATIGIARKRAKSFSMEAFPTAVTDQNGVFELQIEDPTTLVFALRPGYESRVTGANYGRIELKPGVSARQVPIDGAP